MYYSSQDKTVKHMTLKVASVLEVSGTYDVLTLWLRASPEAQRL